MRLPKARITLDIDHDSLTWVMSEMKKTGKSRNEVIGDIVEEAKKKSEKAKIQRGGKDD